jgi:uncharacterized protein (DUF302 family)
MNYYFSKTLKTDFNKTTSQVIEALKTEGFGIVSEIDMKTRLKEKLGVDFKLYKILGACNPSFALKALQAEEKIGTMLPCNFVIIDNENGTTEVAAVHPLASMIAVENEAMAPLAIEVTEKIKRVMELLN